LIDTLIILSLSSVNLINIKTYFGPVPRIRKCGLQCGTECPCPSIFTQPSLAAVQCRALRGVEKYGGPDTDATTALPACV